MVHTGTGSRSQSPGEESRKAPVPIMCAGGTTTPALPVDAASAPPPNRRCSGGGRPRRRCRWFAVRAAPPVGRSRRCGARPDRPARIRPDRFRKSATDTGREAVAQDPPPRAPERGLGLPDGKHPDRHPIRSRRSTRAPARSVHLRASRRKPGGADRWRCCRRRSAGTPGSVAPCVHDTSAWPGSSHRGGARTRPGRCPRCPSPSARDVASRGAPRPA